MNQPISNFEKLRRMPLRRFLYLAILCCTIAIIYIKLTANDSHSAKLPTTYEQLDGQTVDDDSLEPDDPMPVLAADLIPWQSDGSAETPTSFRQNDSRGRVLIVRGILTIFSLGMDDLAKKMRRAGYEVKVTTAAQSSHEAEMLRDHVLAIRSPKPVIIIGHSLGGDKAPKLAQVFAEKNIPVDVLFMLDSTKPSAPPSNVKTFVNMFQDNGTPDWARVLRGTQIKSQNNQTKLINVDIRQLAGSDMTAGINHFNIDANPWIHQVIINMVGNLLPTTNSNPRPAKPLGIAIPVRGANHIPFHGQPSHQRTP